MLERPNFCPNCGEDVGCVHQLVGNVWEIFCEHCKVFTVVIQNAWIAVEVRGAGGAGES